MVQPTANSTSQILVTVVRHEEHVKKSLENVNDIVKIFAYLDSSDDHVIFQSINSLSRIFSKFINENEFVPIQAQGIKPRNLDQNAKIQQENEDSDNKGDDVDEHEQPKACNNNAKVILSEWIQKRYFEYLSVLVTLLEHTEPTIQIQALKTLMHFERLASVTLSTSPQSKSKVLIMVNCSLRWITSYWIHSNEMSEEVRDEFVNHYLTLYSDVKMVTLQNIHSLIKVQGEGKIIHQISNPALRSQFDHYGSNLTLIRPRRRLPWLKSHQAFDERCFELLAHVNLGNEIEKSSFNLLIRLQETKPTTADRKKIPERNQNSIDNHNISEIYQLMRQLEQVQQDDDSKKEDTASTNVKIDRCSSRYLDPSEYRGVMSRAWIDWLKKPKPLKLQKQILQQLDKIIYHFTNPILFYDYLAGCYSSGGIVAIMALGGLYKLIRQYNVDYPDFFKQLYNLFNSPSIFNLKQRPRFFELAHSFLQSAHIPNYMVCAFIKRLSRLSLQATPHGCLIIVSTIYNLLNKHPSAQILIHRTKAIPIDPGNVENFEQTIKDDIDKNASLLTDKLDYIKEDPYQMQEQDPSKSNAQESSLWELDALRNHYVPAVVNMVNAIFASTELKRDRFDLDDIVSCSYHTILEREMKRSKQNSALAYIQPSKESLFQSETFDIAFNLPKSSLARMAITQDQNKNGNDSDKSCIPSKALKAFNDSTHITRYSDGARKGKKRPYTKSMRDTKDKRTKKKSIFT